jgi:hypothetical protein
MNGALIGRGILFLLAIVSVTLSSVGILPVSAAAVIAAGAFFLAATNFGRSCPLFLSVRSLLARKRLLKGKELD